MPNLSDLRRQLLGIAPHHDPPDHYRLLGLARLELNGDVIDHAAERQLDQVHRHRANHDAQRCEALCAEIEAARSCLLDHDAHLAYTGSLQGYESDSGDLDLQAAWRTFSEEFDEAWHSARSFVPDTQHLWLGIPRHQRPASNERLLGLDEAERDASVIRAAAERQIGFVRKFAAGEKGDQANLLLGQLSRARSTLLRVATQPTDDALASPSTIPDSPPRLIDGSHVDADDIDTEFGETWDGSPAFEGVVSPPEVPQPPARVAHESSDRSTSQHRTLLIGYVITFVMLAGMCGWFVFGRSPTVGPTRSTRPNPLATNRPGVQPGAQPPRLGQANPSGPASSVPSTGDAGAATSSSGSSANRDEVEFRRFMARGLGLPPNQIDPKELDRFSAMAKTKSERDRIESIRRRYLAWRSHRSKIDDARFLGNLIAVENSMDIIDRRMQRGVVGDQELQKVIGHLADLEGMLNEYPYHSDELVQRHTEATANAERLRDSLQKLAGRSDSPTPVDDGNASDTANPFIVDSEKSSTDTTGSGGSMRPRPAGSPPGSTRRKWTTSAGVTFDAIVEEVDDERVLFRRASDDRKASMAIDQLTDSDQSLLRGMNFDRLDAKQYASTVALVSTLDSPTDAATAALKESHAEQPTSPYAGHWSAVGLSEGRNRPEEATRLLLQVIRRVEDQRREAGDGRHSITLAAACNNLAVCKVRAAEYDAAATQLAKSLEVAREPFAVAVHNAKLLLARTPTGRPLKATSRGKLERALLEYGSSLVNLSGGYLYSLDADVPASTEHGNAGFRFLRQALPTQSVVENHWCLRCTGTGRLPCEYGNCVRGTVVVKQRVQVAVNQLTGEPIYGDKNFKQTCPNCRGAGGFDCPHCDQGRIP